MYKTMYTLAKEACSDGRVYMTFNKHVTYGKLLKLFGFKDYNKAIDVILPYPFEEKPYGKPGFVNVISAETNKEISIYLWYELRSVVKIYSKLVD